MEEKIRTGKPSSSLPIIVALVPFRKRIDIKEGEILVDGKPLRERIRGKNKEKDYKYLVKLFGRFSYGISRYGLYKKLRKLNKSFFRLRIEALRLVRHNRRLIKILERIRTRGKFRTLLLEILKAKSFFERIIKTIASTIVSLIKRTPKLLSLA